MRETFIKRYIVERTSKAEIRPEERSEKRESCRENLWNEMQLKGPQRQKQAQEENKKEWTSSAGLCQKHTFCGIPRSPGETTKKKLFWFCGTMLFSA